MPAQNGGPVGLAPQSEDDAARSRIESIQNQARSGQPPTPEDVAFVQRLAASAHSAEAAGIMAYWPIEVQDQIFQGINSSGGVNNGDRLQTNLDRERTRVRQEAFRNWAANGGKGPLPPGVDRSGGGTGLAPDAVQSLLSSMGTAEAESIQGQQPGLDAYQEDVVLDQGAGSFLDRLKGDPNAWYDESVEGMNLTEYEAAKQERTYTTGRDAQVRSLDEYDAVIDQGGLTDIDRARIEEMRQTTARRARGQEEAIMADAAEQGRGGGNASLLLRNQAQQAATNQRALGDMQTAALGLERKDQAIRNRGFLGGDVQLADDAIDKLNTENSQATLDNNAAAKNKAEAERWGLEMDHKDENVDVTQGAHAVDHDTETARSERNTDRTNEQNRYNDLGAQAHWGDMWTGLNNKYNITMSGPAFDAGDKSTPGSPGDNGLAGAGQGAIGGASAGAAAGPVGAVVGGAAGGALGFLGSRKRRERGSSGAW